jgi:ketosteroid isomerase-like protein
MSEENFEIAKPGWEAWQRGGLDALAEILDPEIVWDVSHFRDWPGTRYVGIEGVQDLLADFLAILDGYEVGVDETLAAPGDRVVSLAWQRGKGRHSGLEVYLEFAVIFTLRHGKIIRLATYDDREAALEAAGLSE